MPRERAICVGAFALLLWAALATLTLRTAPVPPFLLTTTTFTIGAILGLGTALLIMAGEVTATPALGMAALMVAAGSAVASRMDLRVLFRQQTRSGERSP